MKMPTLFLIAATLAAGSADARGRRPVPSAPVPANCPLAIGFSSYGAGIDRPAMQAIEALLDRDRAVRSVTRHPWGREGEVTLCANVRGRGDPARLLLAIRRLVPARPRGPITIRTAEGRTFEAPPQRR
jgi:hypothetical protein